MPAVMFVLRIVVVGLLVIVLDALFVRLTWPPVSRFWGKVSLWSFRLSARAQMKWLSSLVTVMFLQLSPLVLIVLGGWIAWEVLQFVGMVLRVFVGW